MPRKGKFLIKRTDGSIIEYNGEILSEAMYLKRKFILVLNLTPTNINNKYTIYDYLTGLLVTNGIRYVQFCVAPAAKLHIAYVVPRFSSLRS